MKTQAHGTWPTGFSHQVWNHFYKVRDIIEQDSGLQAYN